jgi:hypothetical protein
VSTIKTKAQQVAGLIRDRGVEAVQLDPLTILALVSVIVSVVQALKACKKTPAEALATAKKPTVPERVTLRNRVHKAVAPHRFLSPYALYVNACLLQAAAASTEGEFAAMFAEADDPTKLNS